MLLFLLLQIIAESVPISSSGHVQLARCIYERYGWDYVWLPGLEEYVHFYSLLLFVVLLSPSWFFLLRHARRTTLQWKHLLLRGFCAELCSTVTYVPLSLVKAPVPLWVGFVCSALLLASLLLIDCWYSRYYALSLRSLCLIGFAQGVAALPGISRMGSTYVVGRALGASPRHAFIWSCTLAVPIFLVGIIKGYLLTTPAALTLLCTEAALLGGACVGAGLLLLLTRHLMATGTIWRLSFYLLFVALLSWIYC